MPQFSITTLGCKVNQYESSAIAAALRRGGMQQAPSAPAAELVVVNTCCVTSTAMRKSRQALRRAVRAAPGCTVLVAGCYGDYHPRRIRGILAAMDVPAHRGIVAGHHGNLAAVIEQLVRQWGTPVGHTSEARTRQVGLRLEHAGHERLMGANGSGPATSLPSPYSIKVARRRAVKGKPVGTRLLGPIDRFPGHQRAFVKVQDGCDALCAFCIVPYCRSVVWSRSIDSVEAECRALVAAGHREIVLCGVFLGAFGRETALRRRWGSQPERLSELVRRVAAIEGLWRLRLSSIEADDVTDELLGVFAQLPNVAPHFHLPLQSGSDRILGRMNRQYRSEAFFRTVARIREALDRAALTTDVIVGFPSETEADFQATLDAASRCAFAKIHAFPFSAVRGTAAWALRNEAPPRDVVKRRMGLLARLERHLAAEYRRQFVGDCTEALVEAPDGKGLPMRRAMTDRYQAVRFRDAFADGHDRLTGRVVRLHIDAVTADGLAGHLVDAPA
jgi:threonylcarbamoyladenosine tRNA methylthiotransferase MtaB